MMKLFAPFTMILLVLNTNALPYQSNNGTGRFDPDVDGIDSSIDRRGIESLIDGIGPERFLTIPRGIPISRKGFLVETASEKGKNLKFSLGSKNQLPFIGV